MRFRFLRIVSIALILPGCPAWSADPGTALPETVAAALAKAKIPSSSFSAYVQEVGEDKPTLSFNADTPRNPASTIKLVTTYVGLEALGPTYTWRTAALAEEPPRNGVLDGDLYLKGYGDPYLVLERFWLLLREIRQSGVRDIRGDVVIDNTYFDVGPSRPGDFDGRPYENYNVVPDALMINFQAVNFRFRPDPAASRVAITADPLLANLQIRNQLQLVDGRCSRQNRINLAVDDTGRDVVFTGRFSRQCAEFGVTRSVTNATDYAYGLFRALWEETGGTIRGKSRVAAVPPGMKTLAAIESVPLTDVITAINKHSNNLMARHLLLTVGAERFGPPGTVEKGQRALQEELHRTGLDFPELVIGNGAGLARETRISVRSLARVLLAAEAGPFGSEYESSLGVSGLDGTVQRRFRNDELSGHMHLKTGTLNGVRAMAGYVRTPSGHLFAVAMIQNASGWGEDVQSALLRWVYRR